MIKETRYLCQYCRKAFDSKDKCLEHEKSHVHPIWITKRFYNSVAHVPTSIHVECEDGTVLEYEYSMKISGPKENLNES